jgi:predicted aspartyl protease
MSTAIVFPNNRNYDPSDNRPYSRVYLTNSTGTKKSSLYMCLVDTGSDYIILPRSAATTVGIALSGTKKTIRGATGSASFDFETNLQFIIEGLSITADVLLDPSPGAAFVPILGRVAILAAFDLGFNVTDWLWT